MPDFNESPDQPPAHVDLCGRQLGDFRLLRRLGRGAMAEVYLAEQGQLQRRVAVKVLRPELADDETYLKRFRREAQAAASLVHANIVQIYEVGHVDETHYIAQEYVDGQNLHEWVRRNGPPDLPHALSIICQVAAALAKAAELDVVHRDIKPENIMITRQGEVKVADFGLARVAREGDKTDLTQVGMTMGTPLYMSPEQIEGKPLDPRSDLYSFGVTCYHMLAGRPPFQAETALGVAVQHLKSQPPPLETLRPDLPPGLCRVIRQMMAKRPDDRCGSAREALRELRRLCQQHAAGDWPEDVPGWETTGVERPSGTRPDLTEQLAGLMKTGPTAQPGRHRRAVLLGGLLATFLLGALLAWIAVRQPRLLAGGQQPPLSIPRQTTALRQYLDAGRIDTEEAWRSVIEYFPQEEFYVCAAQKKLAQIYLREGEYDRARPIYADFASEGNLDEELRAYGLAGLCSVLTFMERHGDAADVLNRLWPIRQELRDAEMGRMLDYALHRNRSRLAPHTRKQWEQWLHKRFPPGR